MDNGVHKSEAQQNTCTSKFVKFRVTANLTVKRDNIILNIRKNFM